MKHLVIGTDLPRRTALAVAELAEENVAEQTVTFYNRRYRVTNKDNEIYIEEV